MKILVFCLGNICRSPAAEGILRNILPEEFTIDSAGTGTWHVGQSPDKRSIAVCAQHGIDISHLKGRTLCAEDGENFDYIWGMDEENIAIAKHIIPKKYHHKLQLFTGKNIPDPYYGDETGFQEMFALLQEAAEKWKDELIL
jgi:protein-tyrosine phosphatase